MMMAMRKHKAGQSIVLLAAGFLFLFALLAIGVDGGMLYVDRRQLQNVADAGALSGAYALESLPLPTYSPAHQKALQIIVDNLPGTTMPGTIPTGASFTQSLGANYSVTVNATGGTGWDQYQVTVTHTDQLQLVRLLGFGNVQLSATATARSGTYPFALILFQNDIAQYDNLQPGGNAAVVIQKASSATAGGGGFSNEGFNVGNGGGAALSFSPCGAAGDLWAVSENPTSASNLAGRTTGQTGDSSCTTHPASYPKPQTSPLPFPSYPEPAVPASTYSTAQVIAAGTYYLCPGTYSSTFALSSSAVVIVTPGVYRFTAAAAFNITGGTLRSATSADYSSTAPYNANAGTYLNCSGTPTRPADGDYGSILEFAPTGCAVAQLTMSGGTATIDLYPSAKYNHISLYVEAYGGASWHTVCNFVVSPVKVAGTHDINLSGGAGYSIRGAIYGPSENATFSGNGSGYGVGQIMLWTAIISGNGTLKENYDPTYLPYFRGLIQ